MSEYLDVAIDAAKKGGELALSYFGNDIETEWKGVGDPVTIADKKCEELIIKVLKEKFPDYAFLGEEGGEQGASEYVWIIDPIDGTYNFERGIPDWGILIALQKDNQIVLGVYWSPLHDILIHAEKGEGCFLNGKKTSVSNISNLPKAYVAFNMIDKFKKAHLEQQLFNLAETRTLRNMDKWHAFPYFLQGKIDARIHAPPKYWDVAPFIIMTEEAGGIVTDFNGNPVTKDSKTFIFTNKELLPKLVDYLHE